MLSRLKILKADDRSRTCDLMITNQLLCQLSYIGVKFLIAVRRQQNSNYKQTVIKCKSQLI
jgi:hypothetical protein